MRRNPVPASKRNWLGVTLDAMVEQSQIKEVAKQIVQEPPPIPVQPSLNAEVIKKIAAQKVAESLGLTADNFLASLFQPLRTQIPIESKPNPLVTGAKTAVVWSWTKASGAVAAGVANHRTAKQAHKAEAAKDNAATRETQRIKDVADAKSKVADQDERTAKAAQDQADAMARTANIAKWFLGTPQIGASNTRSPDIIDGEVKDVT